MKGILDEEMIGIFVFAVTCIAIGIIYLITTLKSNIDDFR